MTRPRHSNEREVSVRALVPASLADAVAKAAYTRDETVSQVIRRALRDYVAADTKSNSEG
jgi:predicted transcriptional regulator